METNNSMTQEEFTALTNKLVRAYILENVKLDLIPKEGNEDKYVSYPSFRMDQIGIFGVPYIFSELTRRKIYISYAIQDKYEIPQSEVIYHAKQNTVACLNRLFKCETETIDDVNIAVPDRRTDGTVISLSWLNMVLNEDI